MWLGFYPVDRPGLVHVLDMIKRLMDGICMHVHRYQASAIRYLEYETEDSEPAHSMYNAGASLLELTYSHIPYSCPCDSCPLRPRQGPVAPRQTGNSPSFLSLPPGAAVGTGGLAKEARDMATLVIWEPQPCTAPAVQFRQPRKHSPPSMHMASVQPSPRPRREVRGAWRSE